MDDGNHRQIKSYAATAIALGMATNAPIQTVAEGIADFAVSVLAPQRKPAIDKESE